MYHQTSSNVLYILEVSNVETIEYPLVLISDAINVPSLKR